MIVNGDLELFAIDGGVNSFKNVMIERLAGGVGGGSLPANGGAASGAQGAGRIVYNTDDNTFYFFDGTSWQEVGTGAGAGGIQSELDATQTSMGYVNANGTFDETSLNALGNVTGLTGGSDLVDALTQLDAAITAAAGVDTLAELTDVTITSVGAGEFLVFTGAVWENQTADEANVVTTNTTQTVSGAKTFSADITASADIAASAGTAGGPSIHFGGDNDTGFYGSAANEIGFSAGGSAQATLGDGTFAGFDNLNGSIRTQNQFFAGNGQDVDNPDYSFTNDTDSGLMLGSGGGESFDIGLVVGGSVVINSLSNGVLAHNNTSSDGVLTAAAYETALANDHDIPNKLYVDNQVAAAAPNFLNDVGNVTESGLADNNFLVYSSGSSEWQNVTAAQARTDLGLVAGGAGDIWVEKAGDTMTGDLVMSSAVVSNSLGTAALPSYTFTGDLDTGMSAAAADTLVLSVAGSASVTMTSSAITTASVITGAAGAAGTPAFSFSTDPDTGMYRVAADSIGFAVSGGNVLTIESDGTLSVAGTTAYENLVTNDDDIPNKRYVDDQITAGVGATSLDLLTDTTLDSPASGETLQFTSPGSGFVVSQDETDYDGAGSNGTFVGGTGYSVSDTITLDDDASANPGTVVTVDAVSSGVVTEFTVTSVSGNPVVTGVARAQASTSGGGTGFTLTPQSNNLSAITATWTNADDSTARTNLGLVAGGTGDIWVEKAGDAMTGNLNMGSNNITSLADPVGDLDAANKQYVDSVASGLDPKESVRVATTDDLDNIGNGVWTVAGSGVGKTLTAGAAGTTTIDGVALADGDRVLVKDEDGGSTNLDNVDHGIYVASDTGGGVATVLTRATDADGSPSNEVSGGNFTFVEQGTVNQDSGWVLQGDGNITVDTGVQNWTQFSGAGAITAGTGLTKAGNVLNVEMGAGIVELPTDEVGIDLFDAATGAIILTNDGTTRGTATGDQLHLLLDGGSLQQGAGGLSMVAITIDADSGTDETIVGGDTLTLAGGTGISTVGSATDTVTFNADVATTAASQGAGTLGVAEFFSTDFSVTSGFVELNPVGVQESVSFTFSPVTGDDIVLTGTADTLNIDSNTLTVVGTAGTATIDIDLSAVLSDLNDVSNFASGPSGTAPTAPDGRNRIVQYGGEGNTYGLHRQDVMSGDQLVNGNYAYGLTGYQAAGIHRGAQVLTWDVDAAEWTTVWSDAMMQASGMNAFFDWNANTVVADSSTHYDTDFANVVGTGWSGAEGATAVFARWDTSNNQWRNFTPAQMVTMLNTQGGLTGVTATFDVTADSGTDQTITTGTDTLTIAGGTAIDTVVGATDTVTINLNASLDNLTDVGIGDITLAAGHSLVYDSGNSEFRNVPVHYIEDSASATSHVITHNLNQQYVQVTVVDTSDDVIIPQNIRMDNANQLTVTLSSAAQVTIIVTGVTGVAVV